MFKRFSLSLLACLPALLLCGKSAQAQAIGIPNYETIGTGVDYLDSQNNISLQGSFGQTFAFSDDPSSVSVTAAYSGFGETAVKFRYAGQVAFQGWVGGLVGIPLNVRFWSNRGSVLRETVTTLTQANGIFTADSWIEPSSVASMRVKGTIWIRQAQSLIPPADPVNGYPYANYLLRPGDINGDNIISLADYSLFKAAYGSVPGNNNWNPNADLNGDGIVSLADYSLFKANYGLTGAP